jgi:Domain of unknown function (DUF4936)
VKFSYYIYYQVPPENAQRAQAAVGAIQKDLAHLMGIGGRLLHRRDDASTWMEIYESVADTQRFESELAGLVERHGLRAMLAAGSSRKQEIFRSF